MTNTTKTTKYSVMFLAVILVAGTITMFSQSFMVGTAQAVPYPDMDREKKEDKKNVSVQSLKCNNINVNVNGLELSVLPPFLGGGEVAAEAVEPNTDASSFAGIGGANDGSEINDFRFICINNNNNTVVGDDEEPIPPETSACTDCFSVLTQTQINRLLAIVSATSIEVYCERLLATPNSPGESLDVRDALINIPEITQPQFVEILQCLIDEGVIGPLPPPPPP